MDVKDYHPIIESLHITLTKAQHIQLLQAFTVENFQDVANLIVILRKGEITYVHAGQLHTIRAGDMLVIPSGQHLTITYGSNRRVTAIHPSCKTAMRKPFQIMSTPVWQEQFDNFSYIAFEAKFLNTVNFFATLGIPVFIVRDHAQFRTMLHSIFLEQSRAAEVGHNRMMQVYTEQLVLEIIRYLLTQQFFTIQLTQKIHFFRDPRLIAIFRHIKDNLQDNLSNKVLAAFAHVSEDYIGQYFRMRTGVNAQEYVAAQRLEQAVRLLRYTSKRIHAISKEVGFKDPTHFCKRFKKKFGLPARKMRSQAPVISG